MTTDGLPNSVADDAAFGNFVQSFKTRIEDYGPAAVTDALPAWLDHFSDRGSGDDMTLVIIHIPPIHDANIATDVIEPQNINVE